jgi:hypothetical protein
LRKENKVPFRFVYEGGIGLFDFGYEPFYQLLRMTLLAKMTTPLEIGNFNVEDYRILHLSHSDNTRLNILEDSKIKFCPHLHEFRGKELHNTWIQLLSENDIPRFKFGYWNLALDEIQNKALKDYLIERYK